MSSSPYMLLLLAGVTTGCADWSRGAPSVDAHDTPGETGPTPTFAADIHPWLESSCGACHTPAGAAGGTAFLLSGDADADYPVTLDFVDADAPMTSRLLRKASGEGHGGGAIAPPGSAEYEQLRLWIAGGTPP